MRLQPPHDMPPIQGACQAAAPIDQTGIEQLNQRDEVRTVAVMRRGGQQQQPLAVAEVNKAQRCPGAHSVDTAARTVDGTAHAGEDNDG